MPSEGFDRNRLDALMHLHRLHFDRFQERRRWEWRLTFTLWGGLVVAANALRGVELSPWAYFVGGTAVVVMHWTWEAMYIRWGAEPNREYGVAIGREIGDMVGFTPVNHDTGERFETTKGYNAWAAHYWQVTITTILVAVLGVVIYR